MNTSFVEDEAGNQSPYENQLCAECKYPIDNQGLCVIDIAHDAKGVPVRAVNAHNDLLSAARKVLAGLNARIDEASRAGKPVPVFDGIAELHNAIHLTEKGSS